LKTRIISAIVMILITVPILLYGGFPFKLLTILLGCFSLYELLSVREQEKDFPLFLKYFSYIILCLMLFANNIIDFNISYIILLLLFCCFFLPIVFINDNLKYNISDAFYLLGSIIFLGTIFNLINIIRGKDLFYFIYLLLITVFTDTFALITGKYFGKHKLCKKVSPNKTIEGSIGGSVIGTIVSTIFYILFIESDMSIFIIVPITLLLSIIGQVGDLFFSSIKRYYKVKDFSNLIPGHGGILDRFDSFIFVVILYTLFINIL